MRSKWRDWDYLNSWIFGTVALGDLPLAIQYFITGECAKGFWIFAVCLYAGIAAWLSYLLFVARSVPVSVVKDAIEFRDGRKSLRLSCGAIVRKIDARDINELRRCCLAPNFGGLRKGDIFVFCHYDCDHANGFTGCDKAFPVLRVGVSSKIDGGRVAVANEEIPEVYWISPGVDDADHVPVAVGPVVKGFLHRDKGEMRVVIPPVLDGHADGHDGRKRDDDGSDGLRDIAPGDGISK